MNAPARVSEWERLKATRKPRWWHETLADYILAHPTATHEELALFVGRTPATISLIVNTDAFKAYFRKRRQQHSEALDAEVRGKLYKIANTSLDHMLSAIDKKRDTIPLEMLHRTVDTTLKSLGYGAPSPQGTTSVTVAPTVNVAVSVEDLEAARAALRQSQQTIDVTPSQVVEHEPRAEGAAEQHLPSPPKPRIEDLA